MSAPVYLATLGLFFGVILVVFAMRYGAAVLQARARLASEGAYRVTAEKAAAAGADTAAALASIQTSLTDLAARMGSVEKILKDVG